MGALPERQEEDDLREGAGRLTQAARGEQDPRGQELPRSNERASV